MAFKKIVLSATTLVLSINVNAAVIGDSGTGNCFPFGCGGWGPVYQQQYNSSSFSGPILINSLSFYHTVTDTGIISPLSGTFTISLSTSTASTYDQFITGASSNPGADNTQVFSDALPATVPFGGRMDIILSNPFYYDPSMGSLLMQVTTTNSSADTYDPFSSWLYFDENDYGFNQTYRLWGDPTGMIYYDDLGLVTGFNEAAVSTVPVPAAVWLFGSGLLGFVGVARRKKA